MSSIPSVWLRSSTGPQSREDRVATAIPWRSYGQMQRQGPLLTARPQPRSLASRRPGRRAAGAAPRAVLAEGARAAPADGCPRGAQWIVHKFGGTCMASAERIRGASKLIIDDPAEGKVIVVSAMGSTKESPVKVTDLILNMVSKAAKQDAAFLVDLASLQEKHVTAAKELLGEGPALSAFIARLLEDIGNLKAMLQAICIGARGVGRCKQSNCVAWHAARDSWPGPEGARLAPLRLPEPRGRPPRGRRRRQRAAVAPATGAAAADQAVGAPRAAAGVGRAPAGAPKSSAFQRFHAHACSVTPSPLTAWCLNATPQPARRRKRLWTLWWATASCGRRS